MASPHVKLPASRFLSITPGAMNEIRQEADADSDLGLSASLRFAVGVASAEPVERQAARRSAGHGRLRSFGMSQRSDCASARCSMPRFRARSMLKEAFGWRYCFATGNEV